MIYYVMLRHVTLVTFWIIKSHNIIFTLISNHLYYFSNALTLNRNQKYTKIISKPWNPTWETSVPSLNKERFSTGILSSAVHFGWNHLRVIKWALLSFLFVKLDDMIKMLFTPVIENSCLGINNNNQSNENYQYYYFNDKDIKNHINSNNCINKINNLSTTGNRFFQIYKIQMKSVILSYLSSRSITVSAISLS